MRKQDLLRVASNLTPDDVKPVGLVNPEDEREMAVRLVALLRKVATEYKASGKGGHASEALRAETRAVLAACERTGHPGAAQLRVIVGRW